MIRILPEKLFFFEGSSWFKVNNFGLTLATNLKFYTSVTKALKLEVSNFFWLNPTFVEVTGKKVVGGWPFCTPPPTSTRPIMNRVKEKIPIKAICFISCYRKYKKAVMNSFTFQSFKNFNCWLSDVFVVDRDRTIK